MDDNGEVTKGAASKIRRCVVPRYRVWGPVGLLARGLWRWVDWPEHHVALHSHGYRSSAAFVLVVCVFCWLFSDNLLVDFVFCFSPDSSCCFVYVCRSVLVFAGIAVICVAEEVCVVW